MAELEARRCSSIADVNENQWNNVVSQSERGTLFHEYEWVRAVEEGFDSRPHHVVVEKGGNPVALAPNFARELPLPDRVADRLPTSTPLKMVSSSYPGFGGPLVNTDERDSLDLLFDELEAAVGPAVVFHRLRSYDLSYVRYGQYLQSRGYEPTYDSCLFFLDLNDGWEAIRRNMDKERRKDLREAHEQEYRVTVEPLADAFDATYDAYVENMERVGGTIHPRAFLRALADGLGERILVFTVYVDGRDVGRYVHLLDEQASVLHHWLSAIPDTDCYRCHPSELLHERAIRWGIERGCDEYGFGETGAHFRNTVFGFKQKYGGCAVPMFTMEKGYSALAWPLYKLGRRHLQQRSL